MIYPSADIGRSGVPIPSAPNLRINRSDSIRSSVVRRFALLFVANRLVVFNASEHLREGACTSAAPGHQALNLNSRSTTILRTIHCGCNPFRGAGERPGLGSRTNTRSTRWAAAKFRRRNRKRRADLPFRDMGRSARIRSANFAFLPWPYLQPKVAIDPAQSETPMCSSRRNMTNRRPSQNVGVAQRETQAAAAVDRLVRRASR